MRLNPLTGKELSLPRARGADSDNRILGSNVMRQHNVLFDIENKEIGFAESVSNLNHI